MPTATSLVDTALARRLAERFTTLAPAQQRAFYAKLRQDGVSFTQFPIVPHARTEQFQAASYAQVRQWFLWQLDPRSSAYHLPSALRVQGRLDETALQASLDDLVARHAALRTVFTSDADGQVQQCVLPSLDLTIARIEPSAASDTPRVDPSVQRFCDTPFDLRTGPLLRVGLLRAAHEEHILVVVMHHIVSDGWSLQVALDELVACYRSRVQGRPLDLDALPIQYTDYAAWQRSWLGAGEQARQLEYWREHLGSEHPVLQLATDWPRRADASYQAARHEIELPRDLVEQLKRHAAAQGASLFMLLLAGWQALLYRHTGQGDIRVGVPIANRHRVETEGLIGLFVNTQVLRAVIGPSTTLRQLLEHTRAAALGAQAHQDLPFEHLVAALQPERSLGHSPLFQVMFNHQRVEHRALEQMPGLELKLHPLPEPAAQLELRLSTVEQRDGVLATFTYARELFAASRIEHLARHYGALLRAYVEPQEQQVAAVALLGTQDEAEVLQWGQGLQTFVDTTPVHDLVRQQALRTPQAVALRCGDQHVSYDELTHRVAGLARHLIRCGVVPEVRVGIALERSVAMVVSVLAVLQAGGAYVPLEPSYPAERLDYMLRDSDIRVLLTQRSVLPLLPAVSGVEVLLMDSLDTSGESHAPLQIDLHPQSLAYVIYTSGSTGRPKGCQIAHGNLAHYLQWAQRQYCPDGRTDNFALYSSLAFDLTVTSLYLPLMQGGTLWIYPDSVAPHAVLREVCTPERGINALKLTPAHIALLSAMPSADVEVAVVGGEALLSEQVRVLHGMNPSMRVYNEYGPTEATVGCVVELVPVGCENVAIGRPVAGCRVYVLDERCELVPCGVPGELYIAGEGLARGYLRAPALTAARFVADPWSGDGERMYRTGDRVRYRSDGSLEYLGRLDQQLKIRGFRIEPGEIEAQLVAHAKVKAAVVVAVEGGAIGAGTPQLVAYVEPTPAENIEEQALRSYLQRLLPDYMLPTTILFVPQLPLTSNGKVDRKALPAPLQAAPTYQEPQSAVEQMLAPLWSQLLGVARVGRHDSFFALGGHSLLAIQMLEQLRQRGWTGQMRKLFESPRLADFAATVCENAAAESDEMARIPAGCALIEPDMLPLVQLSPAQLRCIEAAVPGGAVNIQDIYPLAPLQEGILFQHLMQREGDVYVTPLLLAFDGRERLERFIEDLNEVIERHDILRSAIVWEGVPEPVQVVCRRAPLRIEWPVLTGTNDVAAQLHACVDPACVRIDITRAPLVRAVAAHDVSGARWLLQLPSHHLVLDHTTLELLVEEIALLQRGRRVDLPSPVPFRRFIARVRRSSVQDHAAYFREQLGDVTEPTAPFGLMQVHGGEAVRESTLAVPDELAEQVRRTVQRYGTSAATLFHLAWALVLSRIANRADVVFGTVMFGRMQGGAAVDRAFGLFINTLPLRVCLQARSVASCVEQTHSALADLMQHEHASLALALRSSSVPPGTPLFSSLFNYRHGSAAERAQPPLPGVEVFLAEERTNYPVTLSVTERREGFELAAQVPTEICGEFLCDALVLALQGVLSALALGPTRRIETIDVLPSAQRCALLERGTHQSCNADGAFVHRWFEQRVHERPDAVAVRCDEAALSYRQLNLRANRLAHRLRALGIAPDSKVGLALERGLGMVIGVLAVLKAGAAYVPLDLQSPPARLAYIIEDSGVAMLLTEAAVAAQLPVQLGVPVLELEGEHAGPDHDPQVALHGENLAYVIYTSGSTGRPKGVQITHRNVARLLTATRPWFDFGATDVWTLFHSFAFDFSVWEMFGALCTGGELVVVPFWISRSPEDFATLLRRHRVTVLNRTPSAFRQLLQVHSLSDPASLRYVIFGGETLEPASLMPWIERFGDARPQLINMYGITETTVHVTHRRITRADALRARRSPVGGSIPDLGLRILDGNLNLLPEGVAGELYVNGAGLARGYLNRAALTATRFIADPYDAHGGCLYRTGDVARWRADGELEYLGRGDDQVKVRGFRIELGEIEAQLRTQAEIREALVMVRAGQLVAYVTGHGIDSAQMQQRLALALPDYMVPSSIVVLDAFPLNVNGKIDRAVLPDPSVVARVKHEPPLGAVEIAVAEVWSEVLALERVGREDHFFRLGGHSLLAIQILQRLRARGWRAQVRSLFELPRLRDFAATLEPETGAADDRPLLELTPEQSEAIAAQVGGGLANIQDVLPLAPLQQGILFHHRLQQSVDVYLTRTLLAFTSRERLLEFITVLNQAVARHDILRTAVLWERLAMPVQVVQRRAEIELEYLEAGSGIEVDGAGLPRVAGMLSGHVHSADFHIDIARAPMIRAVAAHDPAEQRWLLQLVCHHLVLDHTTLELLVEEMGLMQRGRHDLLPPVVPLRACIAQSQRGSTVLEQQAFFSTALGDVTEPTAPFDALDVQGDGRAIRELRTALDAELAGELRREARRRGVGAATLFHLAWAMVLAKTTGRNDVVFGTVLFGRMAGTERALGMFINTLPLRVRLVRHSALECLQQTHAALAALLHHEHASLALAQRCSGLPGGSPLFATLLNYRYGQPPEAEGESADWPGMTLLSDEERTNYPITLSIDDRGVAFELVFQTDPEIDAQRLQAYLLCALRGLLSALVARSPRPLFEVELLDLRERLELQGYGVNETVYADLPALSVMFEQQVQRTPQSMALVFESREHSYAQLNEQANRLAHRLRAHGVGAESRVGVCLERSVEMVVALLAVLKAGAAYVPLDPQLPEARLRLMIEDSAVALLLTHSEVQLESSTVPRWSLDGLSLQAESSADPGCTMHPEQLAYVIYTSGSTGRPKAVMVRHGALSHFLRSMQQTPGLSARDVLVAVTSLSFDIAALELYLPLISGARVVLANREQAREGVLLAQLIENSAATVLQSTPAGWRMLRAAGWPHGPVTGLKALCGGEALQPDLAQDLTALGIELWNMYGPTETTIWSAALAVGERVAVGGAIAGTQLQVLDGELRAVPRGVVGEMYLGGVGLARGYLSKAGLTAERFIANPLSTVGERLYRTGDLVRWRADGRLDYLGRIDHQVKLRGYRIELGEIEAQLLAQREVREAVVVAQAEQLIAYVSGRDIQVSKLREALGQSLPQYMVPALIVELERLPLNASGKVDRKALPTAQSLARGYEPPQGELEQALAQLWSEVLGVERIGRHDNFFERGGHSLLAARLLARVRSVLAIDLPLRAVFEHPTLHALAARLPMSEQPHSRVPLQHVPRSSSMALSPLQRRLWAVDRLATRPQERSAYNMAAALQMQGELDVAALRAALNAIVVRHEVLRTAYPEQLGEPWAVIAAEPALEVPLRDCSPADLPSAVAAHAETPFDLASGPVLRAALLRLAPQRHVLLLCVHHIAFDGWSEGVFTRELVALYRAFKEGGLPALPLLSVQYADYAHWHLQSLRQSAARDAEFWRKYLQAAPALSTLPPDRPRLPDNAGAVHDEHLSHELALQLTELARAEQTSLFTVLLSAFLLVLHRHSNSVDLVVGTDVAGRSHPSLEELIGFFVNVEPVRSRLEPAASFRQWLTRTRQSVLDVLEHQHAPLDQIIEWAAVARQRGVSPLVQVLFVMQNLPAGRFELPGLCIEVLPRASAHSKFDLAVFVNEGAGGLHARWLFASQLLTRVTIERSATAWSDVLRRAAIKPETPLQELLPVPENPTASLKISKLDKLKRIQSGAARSAPSEPITAAQLSPERVLPLVIQPTQGELDPLLWAREQRAFIESALCKHGAILFRNFAMRTPQQFEAFAEALEPQLYGSYGDLPKKEGGRNIYRSTPYPERQMILYHNESSHLERWPRKQLFFCELPAPVGGATPIVDCREVLRRLPLPLIEQFECKQLLYVRTFTRRLDVCWQEFFKTESRTEVEARLGRAGSEWQWLDEDSLQTRTRCPAVIRHPLTGERVFFNQVQLHHVHCLDADVRRDLLAMVGLARMPRHIYYGDGTAIDAATMECVGRAYEECAVRFDWRQGDVILLDNMLAAHARDPYEGPRKIVVAMGAMFERSQLAAREP